ncbi:Relish [Operophtera brumata]|uniref:Relish n=1 Tax=Operophtera brumata TaxID=104452 RepID=A0A0L7KSA3_OPEBR|nr:Relish [Operophtera brumata]
MIRNKKGYKKQEVRSKLERLFAIRLSNGDTFLHMTLCSNQPSFVSIVKVISSVNMSHLLNYTNDKQETILHLAVIHGTPRLIALLVAKGKSLLPS